MHKVIAIAKTHDGRRIMLRRTFKTKKACELFIKRSEKIGEIVDYSITKIKTIMNTLMLLKHFEKRIVVAQYFKSEDEAIHWWLRLPLANGWDIIYLKERMPNGHRYELTYAKCDELGVLYSKYIICFSKKEALYLKNKIERINQHYIIQIKRLY